MIQDIIQWLTNNYVEVLGFITALIYLYFSIKQKIWLWPFGIATSAFYIYVFFVSKFYADMGLQVYYLLISFYGWYNWLYGKKTKQAENRKLPVSRLSLRLFYLLLPITIGLIIAIAFILIRYTDSPIPWWDSFTTALSIVATWMLARKILEHWIIWIVVDAVSMGLYIYKGLFLTVVLFFIYTSLAVIGYFEWKKEIKSKIQNG